MSIRVPSYRLHRASGQAVVTLNGRDVYLGPHGSHESKTLYNRLIGEWQLNGRHHPKAVTSPMIDELILTYVRFAEGYYVKDGVATTSLSHVRTVLGALHQKYGSQLAAEFGPLALKALRQSMVDERRWCRSTINKAIGTIKQMFKWAVGNEMVPPNVYQGLQAVTGLRRGRTAAREPKAVKPVSDSYVVAVKSFLSRQVWAMVELEHLTGMRPGEVVIMRGCDLDTAGEIWVYTPGSHKTEHHGHDRKIYLGPKAKQIIEPFLKPDVTAHLFSPADAEADRRVELHRRRKTAMSCGNSPGTNRRASPKHRIRARYFVDTYRRAIQRACEEAFPPPDPLACIKVQGKKGLRWETRGEWKKRLGDEKWKELREWQRAHSWHPNQLRHNAATRLRKQFGLEAARVVLGHRSPVVTEIYAELDQTKAADVMMKIG